MTFCYQTQCEDSCCSPCHYWTGHSCRTYDCEKPWDRRGYWGHGCQYGHREWHPFPSSRCWHPWSSHYARKYNHGRWYHY